MESFPPYQVSPELLKQHGTSLLDFLVQHFQKLDTSSIKPKLTPGELAVGFGREAPSQPKEFGELLQDLEKKILLGDDRELWVRSNHIAIHDIE